MADKLLMQHAAYKEVSSPRELLVHQGKHLPVHQENYVSRICWSVGGEKFLWKQKLGTINFISPTYSGHSWKYLLLNVVPRSETGQSLGRGNYFAWVAMDLENNTKSIANRLKKLL